MAKKIVEHLISADLIESSVHQDELCRQTENLIMDELMVEDRLNEEVREILKKHERDIDRERLDYKTLFDLTKHKFVKERNLIL